MKKDFKHIPPFKWFVLQNFPFIDEDFDAMTNYEVLCKVVEYLNKTIDAVNSMGKEVNTLINWFNNLDVQDEVDKKLDEMAESGELEEIISAYLTSSAITGFPTKADMKAGTLFIDGSIVRTLGVSNFRDGDGSYYRIRTLTSSDVIDDDNIVALTNFATLIAEKIKDPLQDEIDNLSTDIETINSDITIFIGDSYGASDMTNNWVANYCTNNGLTLGTDAFNYCTGSAGFNDINGGDNTYLHQIQNIATTIDKNKVKKIIVAGGWNDRTLSRAQLEPLVQTFANYVKANFPNAKLYVGMIANYGAVDPQTTNLNWRDWLINQTLRGYQFINKYGGIYLEGVEEVMHIYSYFTSDYVHPNADGVEMLARAIKQAETTGFHLEQYFEQVISTSTIAKASGISNLNVNIVGRMTNGIIPVQLSGNIYLSSYKLVNASDDYFTVPLGTYTADWSALRYVNFLSYLPVKVTATFYQGADNERGIYNGQLRFKTDGSVELSLDNDYKKTKYISAISINTSRSLLPVLCQ